MTVQQSARSLLLHVWRRQVNWIKYFSGLFATLAWIIVQLATAAPSFAQSLLRDAETEQLLRDATRPIFLAAGLQPDAVDMYILNDKSLNAFVAGGQNIFIHSGTLMQAQDINEVLGVLAHETGHITGAHIARMSDGAAAPTAISIISLLLGAAAIAAGAGDAGAAVLMGGQSMAQRTFLSYTRVQESSADQAGATFLEAAGISGKGLLKFFDRIRDQELLVSAYQDPYIQTHPLTGDRMARLQTRLQESPYWDKPPDPDLERRFERMQAKMAGFLNRPDVTLRMYPVTDTSANARYARVYAYNQAIEWDAALAEAQSLIDDYPNDPYFHEIKGQIHFENGQVEQALPDLRRAHELLPEEPIIMSLLAQALVAIEKPEYDREATRILEKAVRADPYNDLAWRNLAIVYNRSDDEANASLATAELFLLYGRSRDAVFQAQKASSDFPTGSPRWLRAQDIMAMARANMEREGRQGSRRR